MAQDFLVEQVPNFDFQTLFILLPAGFVETLVSPDSGPQWTCFGPYKSYLDALGYFFQLIETFFVFSDSLGLLGRESLISFTVSCMFLLFWIWLNFWFKWAISSGLLFRFSLFILLARCRKVFVVLFNLGSIVY